MGTSGPNTLPLNNDKQHAHKAVPKDEPCRKLFERMSFFSRAASVGPSDRALHDRRPIKPSGGARRDRTDDLMLAKHALSQLSYGPTLAQRAYVASGRNVRRSALPPEGRKARTRAAAHAASAKAADAAAGA